LISRPRTIRSSCLPFRHDTTVAVRFSSPSSVAPAFCLSTSWRVMPILVLLGVHCRPATAPLLFQRQQCARANSHESISMEPTAFDFIPVHFICPLLPEIDTRPIKADLAPLMVLDIPPRVRCAEAVQRQPLVFSHLSFLIREPSPGSLWMLMYNAGLLLHLLRGEGNCSRSYQTRGVGVHIILCCATLLSI